MKANIGIPEKNLQEEAKMLNTLLADETVLYIKTRNYHWNLESHSFAEIHRFLEEQYTMLAGMIDELAERIRQLGHYAVATLEDYLKLTNLTEGQAGETQEKALQILLDDHETLIREIRKMAKQADEKYEDAGTNDFLVGLMEKHEKMAWMLRSYLPNRKS
ncbi:MAG: DNA starvation/stationary phase protection protein [Thermoflavifilum aggregans]|nr:DNA starvation/stationary phase protection protein [Thermoflavifilum aggregans]